MITKEDYLKLIQEVFASENEDDLGIDSETSTNVELINKNKIDAGLT